MIASGNNALGTQPEKLAGKSTEQLREILEDTEKAEKDGFDRVGRKLNAMLEAVREAKNVAKPVQAALSEAMNAFKLAVSARKQRQQVANLLCEQASNTTLPVLASNPMDSASPVLEEIRTISLKLNDHGGKIAALTAALTGEEAASLPWTEVVKRKASTKTKTKTCSDEAPRTQTKSKEVPRPPRPRPPAIIVRVKDGTYSDTLKKIKASEKMKAVANDIVGLTKTRDGDLLVRVNSKTETSKQLIEALGSAMGDKMAVKEMVNYTKVVIQDLDEQAEPQEIIDAICETTTAKQEDARVVSTREVTRGQKWAVVSLPTALAKKLLTVRKLRVGYVVCRLRLWEDRGRGRCPRCLAFGHPRSECTGPDRQNCCRECGAIGHKAANCTTATDIRSAFRATLMASTKEVKVAQRESDSELDTRHVHQDQEHA